MQEGIESSGEFVVSRGEASELFEAIEASLDEVACLVAVPVDFARRIPVATGWNHGLSAGSLDGLDQGVAVIALAGGQDQADGIAGEADIYRVPVALFLRQVAPRTAGPCHVPNSLDKPSVICRSPTSIRRFAGQHIRIRIRAHGVSLNIRQSMCNIQHSESKYKLATVNRS